MLRDPSPGSTPKQRKLDLSPLLSTAGLADDAPQFCVDAANAPFDKGELAERMVARHARRPSTTSAAASSHYEVQNFNRSIGARISGEIARALGQLRHGGRAAASCACAAPSGQSFGVWNAGGLHLYLEGDANDYVGKGMAGGQDRAAPSARSRASSRKDTVIMGNTCLYGATGGELFAAGQAGERFAVRNSGAIAVVEGAGDHCCEYMTGGVVVRARPHGRQLRRRLHRRLRLRARPRSRLRRPLQPRADRHPPHPARGDGGAPAAPAAR